jgi:hypothetical protein
MQRKLNWSRALVTAVTAVVSLATSRLAVATALGDVAASMPPASFAPVTAMNNWNNGNFLVPTDIAGCNTGDYITQYAEKAPWDPILKRMVFVGQVHGTCYGGRFAIYSDSNSTWSIGAWPPGVCQSGTANSPCFSHAYGHNTVDPATGALYFRQSYTMRFYKYLNSTWTSIPAPPTQSSQCCGALEYFPEMGRLLYLDGDWGLWAYDPSANSWSALANASVAGAIGGLPNLSMASTTVFALYNPVQKVVLFGGGNFLYKVDAQGGFTTMRQPPVPLGVTNAVVSVDPVGGKNIVLAGGSMRQYDSSTDTWQTLAISVPPVFTALGGVGDGLVETPVSTYGVIMYTKYNYGSSAVYLYKHSATPPIQPGPNPPQQVGAR